LVLFCLFTSTTASIATTNTTAINAINNQVKSDAIGAEVTVGSTVEDGVTVGVHVGEVEFDSPTKNLIGEVVILK